MKRVVSFSLWGNQPKYLVGALRNAELCRRIYPGWTPRFYVGPGLPHDLLAALRQQGAEIFPRPHDDWRGLFWRFEAALDPAVAVSIFRDCDSRLNLREAAAVEDWLRGRARLHLMRDHPWHATPVLAGMWGVRGPLDSGLVLPAPLGPLEWAYDSDQAFLARKHLPHLRGDTCVHDEFFTGKKFPTPRRGLEFVGQVFDAQENPSRDFERRLQVGLEAGPLARLARRAFGPWILRRRLAWRIYVKFESRAVRSEYPELGLRNSV